MANFDSHTTCIRCREKGKGNDFCVENPNSTECQICNSFSEDQRKQLATPSYRIKKEKREAKKLEAPPPQKGEELVDPSNVSVIGAVDKGSVKSPAESAPPPEKKKKKDIKSPTGSSTKASKTTTQQSSETKIAELDSKWSERFNLLEVLIMARNIQPTFSADVKVTPAHSPPESVANVSEPFLKPSTLTGSGSSAVKHQPASQAVADTQNSSLKFTGQGSSAMHQPTSQTKGNRPTLTGNTGTDPTHQALHRPTTTDRPLVSDPADTGSPILVRARRDSISSLSSDADSVTSDRPPIDLYAEEGELSEDQDTLADQDQPVSEDQN